MPQISESIATQSPLKAALDSGIDTLSQNQTITFTKYIKLVLPLDGFVFWVNASIVSPGAIFNAQAFNRAYFNQPQAVISPAVTTTVNGSLHYMAETMQSEDETFGREHVLFTAETPIQYFDEISPRVLWIGESDGLRFAFSRQGYFYDAAQEWHYEGDAIYPALESQIIDDPAAFDTQNVIVSNSLPVWLTLNKYMDMYPSFLVDDNIPPPYASVHIPEDYPRALQAAPYIDPFTGSHYQLVQDRVKITMYGLRNFNALDFQDYVFNYSVTANTIGFQDMPVIRDGKRIQSELGVLAMKKIFEAAVSYNQYAMRDVALQFITSCVPTFIIGPAIPAAGH